jgi:hypothetical protein
MKKILFITSLLLAGVIVEAQDYKKVSTPFLLKKYGEAKAEIDKLAADPKNQDKPEMWFWRASIYGALTDDEALKAQYPGAAEVAYTSFQKYAQVDPSFKVMNESAIPGKAVIDNVYRSSMKDGIAYFDKKQWDSSYKYFSRSAEIGDLITKYNWRGNKQAIDTTTVLFSGYAAQNAKKLDDAAKYYIRLADLKITNAPAAGDLKDIYEFLVYQFMQKKDAEQFNKYLGLAKQLYPQSADSWADYETEYTEKYMSLTEKLAAYDKADAAGTLTANQYISYGNMFYNVKEDDKAKLDSTQLTRLRMKAEDAFVKGYNKDKTNGLSAYNIGLINYNDWVGLDDTYEANIKKLADINKAKLAEKDPKKKAAADAKAKKDIDAVKAANAIVEKSQHAYADKGIQWIETAYGVLSTKAKTDKIEKNVLSKSVDYLANLYLWKRDKSKGNAAEYDKYDALYKKYDALHGKF